MKKLPRVKVIRTFITKHSTWFAVGFFLLLASVMTWPFVINPLYTMAAPVGGDVGNSVLQFEAIKRERLNPLVDGVVHSIGQPDQGTSVNVGVNRVSFFSTMFLWITTLATNAITAHSLMTFTGYFLTAFITFLFIRKVTESALIGVVAGYTYGFFPHLVTLARAAPTYTHMWLFILPIWAFWSLITQGVTKKRVFISLLSVLPAVFWTPYYMFHVLLVGLACLMIMFLLLRSKLGYVKALGIAGCIGISWMLIVFVYKLIGLSSQYSAVPVRTLNEAYEQSAHPLMYIVPGVFTSWGSELHEKLAELVPRALDTNIYVGVSCILFGAIAVFLFIRHKVLDQKVKVTLALGISVTFLTFIFSLAPTVGILGIEIPTPNKLVVEIVPALRAGQRLVMPLMAGVSILASLGIYLLAQRLPQFKRIVFIAAAFVVIAADLSINLPSPTTTLAPKPSLTALSKLTPGLTAQYYKSSLITNPQQYECLSQLQHKMPLLNDCALSRTRNPDRLDLPPPVLSTVTELPLCQQPKQLRQVGVTYVIISRSDDVVKKCFDTAANMRLIIQDDTYMVYTL